MSNEKAAHDRLLANKPEGANHEPTDCKWCSKNDQEIEVAEENKIFTQEQHEQLLLAAVEKAKTEATAKADADIVKLNSELETVKASLVTKETEATDLQKKIDERDEEDRLNTLATARAKEVKEGTNFTDEQIETRKAQWAKMAEDDFKVYLDDLREVAKASGGKTNEQGGSSFDATRQTAGEQGEKSIIKEFFGVAPSLAGKL